MKKIRIVLLVSAVVLSLALSIQTHVSGLFEAGKTPTVPDSGKDSLSVTKKSIDVNTGI